jgi:hypothetical protein
MKQPSTLNTLPFLLLVALSPALAQSAAPLTDCDRYAARELTRDQVAPGIEFDQIEPRIALPACEDALRRYPESSRLIYQLARVQLRAGQAGSALGLFLSIANINYAPAQHALGSMYARGEGVDQNDELAFSWFRRSAEEGDAYGQYNLGFMYEKGYGTRQDRELAELWYSKSAEQGFDKAKARLAAIWQQPESTKTGRPNMPVPRPAGSTVSARALGVVPGALVCPDHSTLTIVFRLYAIRWEQTMQDKLTKGESRLLRGPATPLPDVETFGCTLIPPGTPMTLERKTPVPVVVVKTASGEAARGVTLPGMIAGQ